MTKQVPPPKHDLFIVADNVREETGGKLTIIGAFSFGEVQLAKGTPLPAAITLSLYMAFKDGEGTFDASLALMDPAGQQLGVFNFGKITKNPGAPLNLIVNLPVFLVTQLGRFLVEAKLDGKTYQDSFILKMMS
jgi:hypothetical protein